MVGSNFLLEGDTIAAMVEHRGKITGYAANIGYFAHAVGRTNDDGKALIGAASAFPGPGFLHPQRNFNLLGWCPAQGLHVVQPRTLMSRGLYQKPAGALLRLVLYPAASKQPEPCQAQFSRTQCTALP